MKKYTYNEITLFQYIFLITGTQIGIGILTLPREVADDAGTDGWISIILGWILSILVSVIIIQIMKKHPQDTIFDLLPRFFGKWLGRLLSLLFILYCTIPSVLVTFTGIFIIQTWVLPETPNEYILIMFAIPGYLIVRNGLRILGRYAELVFYLTLWMPLLLLVPLKDGNLLHFLPLVKEGWLPIIKTVKSTILSFLGFELAFIFYPFLQDKSKATLGIIIANTMSMIAFLHITLVSFAYYSPDEITHYVWPTLTLLKPIEFPFIERFEVIFLSFYLFIISTTGMPYWFTTAFGISQLLQRKDHKITLRFLIACFIISTFFFNPSFDQLDQLGKWWSQTGTYIAYFFPVCLWVYAYIYHFFRRRWKP